jgi:hypothetical protein
MVSGAAYDHLQGKLDWPLDFALIAIQSEGDVHGFNCPGALAVHQRHVAQIDPDAEHDALRLRQPGVARYHSLLEYGGANHRIDHAFEGDERAVARFMMMVKNISILPESKSRHRSCSPMFTMLLFNILILLLGCVSRYNLPFVNS